jgi:radical SAM protein with 4Fe4S-binding SPASM domain
MSETGKTGNDNRLFFTETPDVGIDITNRCNLVCRHCYNDSGRMPVQELAIDEVISLLDQLHAMGQKALHISGGEPTLHPDFPRIVQEAQDRNMRITMSTSGYYSDTVRAMLADMSFSGIAVSLEGMRENTDRMRGDGVFQAVVDAIPFLKTISDAVTIVAHVSRSNVQDSVPLMRLARELEVGVKFAALRPIGRSAKSMRNEIPTPSGFLDVVRAVCRMRREYPTMAIQTDFDIFGVQETLARVVPPRKAACPAGRSRLTVSYDGSIYPCSFLATPDRAFVVGHIRDGSILEMWRTSRVLAPFRRRWKDSPCRNCNAYGVACVGGCVAQSYLMTGNLHARDPICFVDILEDEERRSTSWNSSNSSANSEVQVCTATGNGKTISPASRRTCAERLPRVRST